MRSIIILIVVVSVSSSKNTFDHHENDGHSEAEHARLWKYFSKNTFQTPPTVRDAMDVVKPSENNNRGAFNLGGIDPLFRSFYKLKTARVPKVTYKKRVSFKRELANPRDWVLGDWMFY